GTLVGCDDGSELGRAEYDIGGFLNHTRSLVASGELRMQPQSLQQAFGRRDLVLQTDTGMKLSVRFSGKRPTGRTDAAHVDVTEGLPSRADWPR
ncbi:MAG TPA: hypothetical protein VEC60_15430, partial [Reyranella sp.]|nr:hypothetical protein [Reyranella sp.]